MPAYRRAACFALTLMLTLSARAEEKKEVAGPGDNTPPEGFVALFNGKDLDGWKGLLKPGKSADPAVPGNLDNPYMKAKLTPEQLAAAQAEADENMRQNWRVEDGVMVFSGKGRSICTAKDYANFEMYVDWKILPNGDSGVYVRETPQIQIWDPSSKPAGGVGSGGLYNNKNNPSKPTEKADKPIGEWNRFWIKMVGDKVTIKLNDVLVVDNVTLENYWDRTKPLLEKGNIQLQNHGNTLWFKNVYIKELQ